MHPIGKLIIFLCLVVIISSVVIKSEDNSNSERYSATNLAKTTSQLKSESAISKLQLKSKIDLKGPWQCELIKENKSQIFIRDKKIKVEYIATDLTKTVLINEKGLHSFDSKTKSGTLITGVNQYLDLYSNLSSLLPETTVLGAVGVFLSEDFAKKDSIDSLLKTCEKKEFDYQVFELPSGIKFQETKIEDFLNSNK